MMHKIFIPSHGQFAAASSMSFCVNITLTLLNKVLACGAVGVAPMVAREFPTSSLPP